MVLAIPILIAFALYFCALAAIGVFFSSKTSNTENFSLGGHSVNYWVTAIATQTSDMGPWLFLGLPGILYTYGMKRIWIVPGLIIGMFLSWHYIAPRLRIGTAKSKSFTLSSYFATQFNDKTGTLQIVGALLSVLFSIVYISSCLVGLGGLFEQTLGIPYHIGILISMIATALYALIGGFIAVTWSHCLQGMFLFCVVTLVPLFAFWHLPNGITDIINAAQLRNISLSPFIGIRGTIEALLLAAGWGLGYFGQPHILVHFMGIDDPKTIKTAKYIGITWQTIVLIAASCIGLIGIGLFPADITNTAHMANNEHLFINMTMLLFAPFFAGLALCGILAATLSTIDSLILTSGTTITYDLLLTLLPTYFTKSHTKLLATRTAALIISCIAIALSWNRGMSVYNLVEYAWSGLGSSFGPLVLASLYCPASIHKNTAIIGMLTGALVSAFWPYGSPLVPGFFANAMVLALGSVFSRKS